VFSTGGEKEITLREGGKKSTFALERKKKEIDCLGKNGGASREKSENQQREKNQEKGGKNRIPLSLERKRKEIINNPQRIRGKV